MAYLVAAVLFIMGLKGLTHPHTAMRGNFMGACGMLLAVVVTLLQNKIIGWPVVLAGIAAGSAIGAVLAVKIPMTSMPQMVAVFNGLGGGSSTLVAAAALLNENNPSLQFLGATALSGLIGTVTFWGSLIAYDKLEERWFKKPLIFPGQTAANLALLLVCVALSVLIALNIGPSMLMFWLLIALSTALGVLLVMPIGGADMPVVIALLNSYSGLAAASTGFVLQNDALIITGSLVGASGVILCQLMCKAMNRSLLNVLLGGMGATASGPSSDEVYGNKIKSTSADEIAILLDASRRVVIVPGYGMAVAQAQHAVSDMVNRLEKRGIEVEFGIHPVAGRMPGHMNVLLAEAEIPYDKMKDMDSINPTFSNTDVVLVIGANDVVNPVARTDPKSPIAGMPILDVDKARTVIVVKRSLSPGFAGIPNPLFSADNTLMYFADGKKAIMDLNTAIAEL